METNIFTSNINRFYLMWFQFNRKHKRNYSASNSPLSFFFMKIIQPIQPSKIIASQNEKVLLLTNIATLMSHNIKQFRKE